MTGMLQKGEADVILADIPITSGNWYTDYTLVSMMGQVTGRPWKCLVGAPEVEKSYQNVLLISFHPGSIEIQLR